MPRIRFHLYRPPERDIAIRFVLFTACLLGLSTARACAQETTPLPNFKRLVIDQDPPSQPYYKMVGDLTGNGHLEIVVAGRTGPIVMYQQPDWKKMIIAENGFDGGVNGELADINNDRSLDIVMGGVVWFQNPGPEADEWSVHQIDRESIHDVEVADLDGDGRVDVVCRDQSAFGGKGDSVFVYYQLASDSWRKEVVACPHGEGLKVADVDGDGRPDIVIASHWLRNDSGKWLSYAYAPKWSEPDTKIEVGDINGDQRLDIIVTPAELKGERYRISWFESPAGDKTQVWAEHVMVADVECVVHSLAVADFNLDEKLDVAYAEMHQGADPDEVVVLFNLDRGLNWARRVIDEQGSHDIVAADLSGSEAPDVVGANHAGVHPLVLWENELPLSNSATTGTPQR